MYFTDLRERESRVRVLKITQNTCGGAGTKACVLDKPCSAKDAVFVATIWLYLTFFCRDIRADPRVTWKYEKSCSAIFMYAIVN